MKKDKPVQFGYFAATVVALIIIGLGYLVYFIVSAWYHEGRTRSVAGIPEPKQTAVTSDTIRLEKNGWEMQMKYIYSYDIEALVLHTKEYSVSDNMGDAISPLDLLLCWGKVAENNEELDIKWDQGYRSGSFDNVTDLTLNKYFGGNMDNIITNISNNHLIPAEKNVEKDLLKVRKGDHIRIRGYLVNIDGVRTSDGATSDWYSSTVRDDYVDGEGGQGCEVIYVTNVDWIDD